MSRVADPDPGTSVWVLFEERERWPERWDLAVVLGVFSTEDRARAARSTVAASHRRSNRGRLEIHPFTLGETAWTEGFVTVGPDDDADAPARAQQPG
jgi:hypothetical protein